VMEHNLHACGIRRVGDLALLSEQFLKERFGEWGLALAGKSRGLDAGGWFDTEVGAHEDPKSISHEHTFGEDTADPARLEATIARLTEQVARRLREHGLFARTVQLKLRFSDFSTITRAHSLDHATQLDKEILDVVRDLLHLHANRVPGAKVRLLGVHASGFTHDTGQLSLIDQDKTDRWRRAMGAVDDIRDRFGESSLSLARAMQGRYRERTHENPVGLPGRDPPKPAGK